MKSRVKTSTNSFVRVYRAEVLDSLFQQYLVTIPYESDILRIEYDDGNIYVHVLANNGDDKFARLCLFVADQNTNIPPGYKYLYSLERKFNPRVSHYHHDIYYVFADLSSPYFYKEESLKEHKKMIAVLDRQK